MTLDFIRRLKRLYFGLLIPPLAGIFAVAVSRYLGVFDRPSWVLPAGLVPVLFFASAVLAVAFPIFVRSLFAHRMRNRRGTPENDFLRFEQRIICFTLSTPYLAFVAYLFKIPGFYFAAVIVLALYAAYYFYPSQKRIQFDRRIFRVQT
jgi:hypothetical protein